MRPMPMDNHEVQMDTIAFHKKTTHAAGRHHHTGMHRAYHPTRGLHTQQVNDLHTGTLTVGSILETVRCRTVRMPSGTFSAALTSTFA